LLSRNPNLSSVDKWKEGLYKKGLDAKVEKVDWGPIEYIKKENLPGEHQNARVHKIWRGNEKTSPMRNRGSGRQEGLLERGKMVEKGKRGGASSRGVNVKTRGEGKKAFLWHVRRRGQNGKGKASCRRGREGKT